MAPRFFARRTVLPGALAAMLLGVATMAGVAAAQAQSESEAATDVRYERPPADPLRRGWFAVPGWVAAAGGGLLFLVAAGGLGWRLTRPR